jgi:hypothetical protein
MKKGFVIFLLLISYFFYSCEKNSMDAPKWQDGGNQYQGDIGFGVSGLLFENNLVMWSRENSGSRSELFPQIYFTRTDAANYPVWGSFPNDLLVSGGVPRDGIPALVNPESVEPSSSSLSYLKDTDLVLGLVLNGEVKAYPHNILWHHEIINDQVGGKTVIMSFCPLTGTGILFNKPHRVNLIDRLELMPVIETTWAKWKELYPETKVISKNTGFNRDYTIYPYNNYRDENSNPLFVLQSGNIDTRYPPKHIVLGVHIDDVQKAYPFSELNGTPVLNDEVNGKEVLVVSDIKNHLAVPFARRVGGQLLSFELISDNPFSMKDRETGSTWNIMGVALSGPNLGEKLEQIPAHNAFWFAWAAFWSQTEVHTN